MAEIERAGGAEFERVAGGGDVLDVQFGATANQAAYRGGLKITQGLGVMLDHLEKLFVANEGDFHGFDVAGAFVTGRERGEQLKVVDDGERRREGTDEIL